MFKLVKSATVLATLGSICFGQSAHAACMSGFLNAGIDCQHLKLKPENGASLINGKPLGIVKNDHNFEYTVCRSRNGPIARIMCNGLIDAQLAKQLGSVHRIYHESDEVQNNVFGTIDPELAPVFENYIRFKSTVNETLTGHQNSVFFE